MNVMLKIYSMFIGIILFVSCSDTIKEVKYYDNGNIKEKHIYFQNKKIDSSLFFFKDHSNIIKKKIKYKSNDTMEVTNYYTNGKIFSFGRVLPNGNKIGWWKLYTFENKLEGEIEYLNIDNSEYVNRMKRFLVDKDSIMNNYYSLSVNKDTVKVNELLKVHVFLTEPFFSYHSNCYILIAKNTGPEFTNTFSNMNTIELDTIKSINKFPKLNLSFGKKYTNLIFFFLTYMLPQELRIYEELLLKIIKKRI